jgi:hypothetical protein
MEIKTTPGIKGRVRSKKLIKQIKRHLLGKPMLKNEKK